MSREEVVWPDDEKSAVRGEAFSRVKLCLEKSPSLVYEEGESTVPNGRAVGSEKRTLSWSMISVRHKKWKTATRSRTGKEERG